MNTLNFFTVPDCVNRKNESDLGSSSEGNAQGEEKRTG